MLTMQQMRAIFDKLDDPRARNARFSLFDIIFISLAATLAGAETCFQFSLFAKTKQQALRELLGIRGRMPSHDTFSRIFRILDPHAFEATLRDLNDRLGLTIGKHDIVSFDGKSLRGATAEGGRFLPLHLVNVWATKAGMALAQVKSPNRNEVAGALRVLDLLQIEGAIVTADALHCRADIAKAILDKGADYVLALKANQPNLCKAANACIEMAPHKDRLTQPTQRCHGRFERRRATVVQLADPALLPPFPGVQAVARIEYWRGKRALPATPTFVKLFLLSRLVSARRLLRIARDHWKIENHLHWRLDVTFGEDHNRARKDNAPQNIAVLRKIAINILSRDTHELPTKHKLLRAAWLPNSCAFLSDGPQFASTPQ
jgi:predicted transposase YbfD/YdcC